MVERYTGPLTQIATVECTEAGTYWVVRGDVDSLIPIIDNAFGLTSPFILLMGLSGERVWLNINHIVAIMEKSR